MLGPLLSVASEVTSGDAHSDGALEYTQYARGERALHQNNRHITYKTQSFSSRSHWCYRVSYRPHFPLINGLEVLRKLVPL